MGVRRREDSDTVTVVRFSDTILDAINIQAIKTKLYQLVDRDGCRKMLLDFQEVKFVSSAALGVLMTLQKKITAAHGTLVVCGLDKETLEVFQATRLDEVFRVCPDNSDVALTYFSTGSASKLKPVIVRFDRVEEGGDRSTRDSTERS